MDIKHTHNEVLQRQNLKTYMATNVVFKNQVLRQLTQYGLVLITLN